MANSPTRYVPRQSLTSAASIQKRDESPKSFRIFSKLPLEVQDLIWKEVLDLDAPTVHGVELRRSTTDQPTVSMVETGLWNSNTGVARTPIYPVRDALHRVCRRSRAAGKRESRLWRGQVPYELRADRPWAPTQPVDLGKDLFIISNHLEEDINEGDKISGVRHVGVTWEGLWDLHVLEKLEKVVDLFPELETVYVVVTGASTTHPHLEAWESEKLPILEKYLKECQETASIETDIEFLSEGLIYQEIAPKNLSEMGGLHEPLEVITQFYENFDARCAEAKAEGEELRRPVIRMMTWEQAHRVSPRFS
ncbi:hypothetical protein NCS57_01228700 [Fusarium keratoplasticum]|uniref:Uncharacterized protein n=1 Tax=Fusarium keratoplasticum TaxID=1328300 RepID=A0ACC0QH19_9HYPO|nr:hypothetical protein NCS57_01228700 [Fusarium keratoplasticum]KAI8654816.1 hypothetical protein NCS57_01228700 [Fusarium keratoplasticum]KAI8655663.1 hypothetical protein NCS55_01219000 [Fusarium keratoplasticum]